MFDESLEDLAELAAEYHEHHSPADTDQRLLVDTLIHNEWRLRRMCRVDAVLWEHAADAFFAQHPEAEACNSADAFTTNSGQFERLQVARGHALRVPEPAAEPPQPQQSTTSSAKLASFRQDAQTPPPATSFAAPAAPASPAETQPGRPNRFPTPREAMDAAVEAISKESLSDLYSMRPVINAPL